MACSNRNSIFQENASGGGWVFDSVKERKHIFYCKKLNQEARSRVMVKAVAMKTITAD